MGFTESDGDIILDGENFSLKVDKNRKIYLKNNMIQNPSYTYLNFDMPINMSADMKKQYLMTHYKEIEKGWQNRKTQSSEGEK